MCRKSMPKMCIFCLLILIYEKQMAVKNNEQITPQFSLQMNFNGSNIFGSLEICSGNSARGLIMVPDQEANSDNLLRKSF